MRVSKRAHFQLKINEDQYEVKQASTAHEACESWELAACLYLLLLLLPL